MEAKHALLFSSIDFPTSSIQVYYNLYVGRKISLGRTWRTWANQINAQKSA